MSSLSSLEGTMSSPEMTDHSCSRVQPRHHGSWSSFGGGVACLASWEVVQSPVIRMLLVSPVLPGSQGDCRRERLRAKEPDAEWRQGGQAFSQLMGPGEETGESLQIFHLDLQQISRPLSRFWKAVAGGDCLSPLPWPAEVVETLSSPTPS
jgi:hypothetical protein